MQPRYLAYWALVAAVTLYAVLKQRREAGCRGTLFTVRRQCRDDRTVYSRGLEPSPGDGLPDLLRKLDSALSFHEKAAVWRVCIIMALALTGVTALMVPAAEPRALVGVHITAVGMLYFYFNYVNYHHHRTLQGIGKRLTARVAAVCPGRVAA